uniref:C3H1-type domain-containing protein n=1 Tax=Ciona savignyi TaxID=51511 RepID=H2ZJ67_CIOSA
MLPSLGYFRGITCPDETNGKKCLRPYCHFRHTKLHTDSESGMPTINLEVVQKAISQLKSDVSQHSKSASTFNSSYFQGEVSHPYEPESLSDETDTQETFETSQGGDEDNAKSAYSGDHKGYTPASSGSSK